MRRVPPTPMLLMQEGPWLRHGAVAIVNTKGCGGKQSCLCSLGRCWRWLMCPLAPVWALGGGVAALGLHAGQKDPWACRERSLTHIVSPSGLASGYFTDAGYRDWLCQSWWACMQMDRCCRSWMVWWARGIPAAPGTEWTRVHIAAGIFVHYYRLKIIIQHCVFESHTENKGIFSFYLILCDVVCFVFH